MMPFGKHRGLVFSIAVISTVTMGLLVVAASAGAEPCQNCNAFRAMVTTSSLASDVSDIGLNAIHTEGSAFYTKVERAAALRLKIDADKMIPDYCKSKLKAEIPLSTFDVYVRHNLIAPAAPTKFVYDGSGPGALYDAYNNTYASKYNNACTAPADGTNLALNAAYSACLKTNAPGAYKQFSKDLLTGDPAALAKA
ncbi:MAG: hypothetical protein HY074_12575, partial [Deltaproteobacteria bacterium]|nr:hypothetical protein [Deltaproteobacteria bacterium]